jgi:hypothetical protein
MYCKLPCILFLKLPPYTQTGFVLTTLQLFILTQNQTVNRFYIEVRIVERHNAEIQIYKLSTSKFWPQ